MSIFETTGRAAGNAAVGKGGPTRLGGRPATTAGLPPRWVALQSDTQIVVGILIDVDPTAGGGIETTARRERTPLTAWTGSSPEGMTLEILFDGLATDATVEPQIRAIEEMAGGFIGGREPAELIVSGRAVPHGFERASQNRWQISEPPQWGAKERNADGDRVRQWVTLTLLLVSEAEQLERIEPRTAAPKYELTTAKSNDTFAVIAARELGNRRLGGKLMRLNRELGDPYFDGWRSVDRKIKSGTQVRLPTAATLKDWKRDLKAGR